jgi:hypothetical protein
MAWLWTGRIAFAVFALFAAVRLTWPDPTLWTLVYVGAAAASLAVARQRRVIRWVLVILIVFPVEMIAMSSPIGPWAPPTYAYDDPGTPSLQPWLDAGGMALVALWSTALLVGRRFRTDGVI